jgi:splicing factor U2AF subunit
MISLIHLKKSGLQIEEEDLMDDEEYADIMDDIKEEVERKYGKLTAVEVPRPRPGVKDTPGVGLVFLAFEAEKSSLKAQAALNGRKFGENVVVSSFFNEATFSRRELS